MTVIPTSNSQFTIRELARSLGEVLTSEQLDALDRLLDKAKEDSK